MSALTLGHERRQPAMVRSFALAFAIHAALLAVMFLGVRWQIHPPETITVELWEPPATPRDEPRPAPKPEPKPVAKPEPEPEVKKPPEIVEKPKPKPEPKKAEAKPEPKPKADREMERIMREQLASEQKALDQERREQELKNLLSREQAAAKNKALAEYIARITAKVRANWLLPPDIKGNPEAVFSVVQLPTGEVLSARIVKSSGNRAYDMAVERAILKSSPLPLPAARELFARELTLTFRPYDK
ncbi:MAG: TonB family protein [Betaproteobacteria bacterium]